MQKFLFSAGAILGLTAVVVAAAASHAFNALPPANLQLIRTALQIHAWHAVALLAVALWLPRGGRLTQAAGLCLLAGTVIFCLTVYAIGLNLFHLPLAAPIGGFTLMAGWLLLAVSAWRP